MTARDRRIRADKDVDGLEFDENGLIPVVAQDRRSGAVLMLAWANAQALRETLSTGEMHYWSRSRQELWRKGATSGNVQRLVSLHGDCDGDTVLALVEPAGPACHTGDPTCFGAGADPAPSTTPSPETPLAHLWATLEARSRERPEGSYTSRLLDDENLRVKKLGEEGAELLTALVRGRPQGIREEAADLVYHLLVALLGAGVRWEEVEEVLAGRRR